MIYSMRKIVLTVIAFNFLLSSCIDKIDGPLDIPLSNLPKIEIPLLEDYSQKVYYNLSSQSIVKVSKSYDWEIAFSGSQNLPKVIMNYALGLSCNGFTQNDTNFSLVVSDNVFSSNTLKYANYYDSFANLFSENFSGGVNQRFVYYLHFGADVYKKFQILELSSSQVSFRYSDLNGSNEKVVSIPLNANQNYTYYSILSNAIKDVEPASKDLWDLEFTHYTTYIYDFNQPRMYGVTGVLSNPAKDIKTTVFENISIEEITSSKLSNAIYSSSKKGIGYEWKRWSSPGQQGYYTIEPRSYGINVDGKYFAIQFVEFSKTVDGKLTKGYPSFLQNQL